MEPCGNMIYFNGVGKSYAVCTLPKGHTGRHSENSGTSWVGGWDKPDSVPIDHNYYGAED